MKKKRTITRDQLRRQAGFVNIIEAATMLELEPRWFRYQLESGVLPRPSIRIGTASRRYYSLDQVIRMRLTLQSNC